MSNQPLIYNIALPLISNKINNQNIGYFFIRIHVLFNFKKKQNCKTNTFIILPSQNFQKSKLLNKSTTNFCPGEVAKKKRKLFENNKYLKIFEQ